MKTKILLLSMTLVLGIFNQQVKADIIKKIGSSDGGVSKASGADFKSLGEAISAINTNTGNVYSGAVSLQVIDNTYDASQLTINPSLGIKTISPTLGSGYVAPVVTINGGTRTTVGNLVTTVINGMVTNITMTGGAWTVAPTSVTIADPVGGGTTAIVTGAYISGSQVVFPITNCGTGYGPVATFVGGGGSGASLETKILTSATAPGATPATVALAIALACPGSGYTSTPTISFSSGGSGSGAAATVTAIHPSTYSSINIYPTVTGKSIGANFAGSLIFLGGTTNLTIDGRLHNSDGSLNGSTRDLTITNPSVYKDAYTIRIDGGSKNNTIKYCTIKGSSTVNYRGTIGIYVFGNNNNTISNNLFTNSDGSNRPVNSIHAVGSGAFPNTNNTISNNEFADFVSPLLGGSAINIGAENNAWTITGNSFYELNASPNAASSSYSIISISNLAATGFVITDNYIGGSAANCGGTAWTKSNAGNNTFTGIYLNVGGMPACSVQNNTIKNISWSNSAAAAFTGINYTGSAMDIGTTTGNTIGATTGTGSIVYMAGTTGNSNILFTGINIVNKGTGGYCSNNKIGSITAGNSTNTLTYVVGIFNNLSSGTSYINNNTIGSSSTASSINASSTAASQILFGIQSNSSGTSTYSGNIISNISNATTGAGGNTYGFSTSGGTNTINGNYINNLSCPNSTSAFPSTIIGIYVGTSAASSTYTYTNNIISLVDITPCTVYGIFEQNTTSTGFTNFYYNTIYLGGTQASGSGTQSFCFRSTNNTTNLRDIRNNIFVNARSTTGVSSKHNAFYYGVVPAANTITCDYNAYWFSGTAGYLGTFNGAYPSVLPLVTGQIGNDAHSFKIDPLFTNAGGTNAVDYIPS
ncbi:MAG: beta strand repeat-containing protein, partial [Bacteroidales bacterium]